jgi:transcriptional regulator with XRE-family HTH domain
LTRMKSERLRRGWTQQRLAVEAGVGYADISSAERGLFRLYPGQAKKIARVLDLDPDELLEEVPNDG